MDQRVPPCCFGLTGDPRQAVVSRKSRHELEGLARRSRGCAAARSARRRHRRAGALLHVHQRRAQQGTRSSNT